MPENDDGYPRILDRQGCLYGQEVTRRLEKLEGTVEGMEAKIDKLIWAVAMAAFGLATSAILLAANLLV